jgi:hypothetical protein
MPLELSLPRVELGKNFFATKVWVGDGPIVLVSTLNSGGVERSSRLDMQKSMFIDPLPHSPSAETVSRLIAAVRVAQKARR